MKGFMECPLFKGLKEEDLFHYLKKAKAYKRKISKGDIIFQAGDRPENLYVLLSGAVQIEKLDFNGRKHIINRFKEPGTVFGEIYLFMEGKDYDYDCGAYDDGELLVLPKKACLILGARNEDGEDSVRHILVDNMLNILASKAFYLNQKLLIHSSFSLRQKIATYLLQQAKGQEYFSLRLNREELADYLATSRPSLSRELMKMQKEGLLEIFKEDVKIDAARLKKLL